MALPPRRRLSSASSKRPQRAISRGALTKDRTRFAFVVHLLATGDLRRFDSTLEPFSDEQLTGLRSRIAEFVKPFPLDELAIEATDSSVADGELIVLPHLPSELLALSGNAAVALVQSAVDLASERGAKRRGTGRFQLDRRRRRPRVAATTGTDNNQRQQPNDLDRDSQRGGGLRQARLRTGGVHGRGRRRLRRNRPRPEPAVRRAGRSS